ncbi:MAG: putative hydrolase [Thermomicrobiales bacterium]|nr:putative hydrolase [Thermomicrobiales bacterium]MDF3015204.1 putative hydrolase [Thermomicrobiales bacterium]
MADATENQFLGALLGMAIGDALGAPLSGMDRAAIAARFGTIDRFQGATQTGGEDIHPGEFTDETEVALCIVESMTANRGNLDLDTAGVRMLHLAAGPSRRWMHAATAAALDAAAGTLEFSVPIDEDGPATGDVASRGVPVGLVHAVGRFDASRLRADAEAVVRLTHGGPAAFNAATAVAYAVRLAATGEPRESWARHTAQFLGGGELAERLAELDLILASTPLIDILEWTGTGLDAIESVPAAFAAAMTEPVFENAVFAAVSAGGATDTIGGLTGALGGAAEGASGIPQDLIDGLEGRIYVSLAAPWFHKAARQRAGHQIDLRPVHGPRPKMPPRQ